MSDVIEVNVLTGEIVERGFTPEELAQREADADAAMSAAKAEAERLALVASARAKVAEASGLTPEEMAALGF